ncbi:hypothetical protein FB451DRAFT_1373346 [Mycena latifolia]|nr:hypothetical protein FB451DRAFT_1373346 [Mycena latifolia]
MRFASTGALVLALAASTVAFTPTSTRSTRLSNLPSLEDLIAARSTDQIVDIVADPVVLPRTNAERLARGLPLLKPHRRDMVHPARAQSSPVAPTTVKCNIQVQTSDGANRGYLSTETTYSSFYGKFQANQGAGALEISLSFSSASSSQLALTLGGIVGYFNSDDNIYATSYNYMWLGGTTESSPGSPPVYGDGNSFSADPDYGPPKKMESAIWSYDPGTKLLAPQWINTDSSAPPTVLAFAEGDENFVLIGSVSAYNSRFSAALPATFTCVTPLD